jgi:pyridoxal phosphate enzyme (YggS family)
VTKDPGLAPRYSFAPEATPSPELVERVAAGLADVRDRIRAAGGEPEHVRIIAVTKGFGARAVAAALLAGARDIGENYADELLGKLEATGNPACRWHYLGSIQRNKVPKLAPHVHYWHGVARVLEAEAIIRRNPDAKLLVEVDTTGQPGRGGCPSDQVAELVTELTTQRGWQVEGLMTVAPPGDAELARAAFATVARLRQELGLRELSMGMSGDLEEAVAAGATMVRVGTALLGARPSRRRLQQ